MSEPTPEPIHGFASSTNQPTLSERYWKARAIKAEAEVTRLRENEYAVLHKGLDLMAWVKVAEAAQARVRELEEAVATMNERQRLEWARAETAEERVRVLEAALWHEIYRNHEHTDACSQCAADDAVLARPTPTPQGEQ